MGKTPPRKTRTHTQKQSSRKGCLACSVLAVSVICGLTMFATMISAYAMYGDPIHDVEEILTAMLGDRTVPHEAEPTAKPAAAQLIIPIPPAEILPIQEGANSSSHEVIKVVTIPATETITPTDTPTSSLTPTPSSTPTPTPSMTVSSTVTRSMTPTRTMTIPATFTRTSTPSRTPQAILPTQTSDPVTTSTLTPDPSITNPTLNPSATQPTSTPIVLGCTTTLNPGFENQVVDLVNAERIDRGLHAYAVQSQLQAAARAHAADMACNGFHSHTGSDGSSVGDRVRREGYSYSWIGENYMITGDTANGPQIAFDWWMNSTPHRNNILSPNYTEFGVGYIYNRDIGWGGYFVIVFARP